MATYSLALVVLGSVLTLPGRAITLRSFAQASDDEDFRILAVSGSSRAILAATDTNLYRLSPELEQEEVVSFTSNTRLLVVPSSSNGAFAGTVLRCGATCQLLNATDFTDVKWSTEGLIGTEVLTTDIFSDGVVTQSIGLLEERIEGGAPILTLTSAQNDYIDGIGTSSAAVPSRIARGSLIGVGQPQEQYDYSQLANQTESDPMQGRQFLHTFSHDGFTYFVSTMSFPDLLETRVSRVCNNDTGNENEGFDSYVEITLECVDNDGTGTAATFVPTPNDFGFDAIVLSVEITRLSEARNRLCAFNVSRINEMMAQRVQDCARGIGSKGLERDTQTSCQTLSPEQQVSAPFRYHNEDQWLWQ